MMRSDHSWQRPCASPLSLVVEGKEGWEKARTHGHNEPCELLLYWKLKVKRGICNAVLGPVKPFLDSLHTSQKLGRVKLEQLYCPSRNMSGSLAVSGAVCVCVLPSSPSLRIKTGFSAPFPHKETTCLHRGFSWETKIQPSLPSV